MQADVAYYKFITAEGHAPQVRGRFDYAAHLANVRRDGRWQPGPWLPEVPGPLMLCSNGYHWCRLPDLFANLTTRCAALWTVEPGGDFVEGRWKGCSRTFRFLSPVTGWNEGAVWGLAVRYVERVLPLFQPRLNAGAARVVGALLDYRRTTAAWGGRDVPQVGEFWASPLFYHQQQHKGDPVAWQGLDAVYWLNQPNPVQALMAVRDAVQRVRRAVAREHSPLKDVVPEALDLGLAVLEGTIEDREWEQAQLTALITGQEEQAA